MRRSRDKKKRSRSRDKERKKKEEKKEEKKRSRSKDRKRSRSRDRSAPLLSFCPNLRFLPVIWICIGCYTDPDRGVKSSVAEPKPVQRSGSGSTTDKTDEIFNDILFVSSQI